VTPNYKRYFFRETDLSLRKYLQIARTDELSLHRINSQESMATHGPSVHSLEQNHDKGSD